MRSRLAKAEVLSVSAFQIKQNYPNPFNPSTKIRFAVPENKFVNLSVYNLLGENVVELVNEVKDAGEYEVNFNAANLPSGIYIAKINAGTYSQSIKMTLLK